MNADDYAVVYLVTQKKGFNGNLFILKIDDAMKFCEDDCSKGNSRGSQWIMMWTSLKKYAKHNDHLKENKHHLRDQEPFVFMKDTGKQDKDFKRLGIEKPTLEQCKQILEQFGYKFTTK